MRELVQMHVLAELLAKEGRVGVRMAAALGDAIARMLMVLPHTPVLLLQVRPEFVEVGMSPDGQTTVARMRTQRPNLTRPYLAWPELFDAWSGRIGLSEAGGERAAVYVVTTLLRHLLSGAPTFVEDDLLRLCGRHRREDPPRLAAWLAPLAVAWILDAGLARQSAQRLASLETLRSALAEAVSALLAQQEIQLRSLTSGQVFALTRLATGTPDGALAVQVGRSDARIGLQPELDLAHERSGGAVHRRQAILRCERASGWTVEDWSEPGTGRSARGRPTAVNGVQLNDLERRQLIPGDLIAFGPVLFRVEPQPAALAAA